MIVSDSSGMQLEADRREDRREDRWEDKQAVFVQLQSV